MKLGELENKKILILGFAREGRETLSFLRKLFPRKVIGLADAKPISVKSKLVRKYSGKNYLKALKRYEVIIKSPGIPFKILPKSALRKISGQTEIFFDNCPGRIVGVTGTKGKSTTASLIYEILRKGGFKAYLVGNIGQPALPLLSEAKPKDVFVYELSSHQLYNLRKSPQIAVFLNIYPEHLDYYRNFKEYASAKANICRYQTKKDFLVYNSQDRLVKKFAQKSKARKVPIKGAYHQLGREAAKAVAKIFRIPSKIVSRTIKQFKPLPHRLERVGQYKGITFYNDALATIPQATIGAIEELGKKVETIILGGFERKIDFKELAKKVVKSKIKTIILFPTTGQRIWREIVREDGGELRHFFTKEMREAVRLAYLHTSKGKICLLSTASASFNLFRDYKEKGNLFKKYVKQLAQRKRF